MLLLKLFLIDFALVFIEKLILYMRMLFLRNHIDVSICFKSQLSQYFLLPSFLLFFFLFRYVLVQNFPVLSDREFFVIIQANNYEWKNMYWLVRLIKLIIFHVIYETVSGKDVLRLSSLLILNLG